MLNRRINIVMDVLCWFMIILAHLLYDCCEGKLQLTGYPPGTEYVGMKSVTGRSIFTCEVESDHPVTMKYLRDGQEINLNEKPPWPRKHPDGVGLSIVQWPFSHHRSTGVFECQATNGVDAMQVRKVNYMPVPIKMLPEGFPNMLVIPTLPRDDIYIGSDLTLHCNASGKGKTDLAWFVNHIPLSQQDDILITASLDNTRITLHKLGSMKDTVVQCYAANDVGIQSVGAVTLNTVAPTPPPTTERLPGVVPVITTNPKNASVNGPNQIISFDCEATGDPAPKYSWKLSGFGFVKENADDGHFEIKAVISGDITCYAKNFEGEDSAKAYFSVKPIPFLPFNVKSLSDDRTQTSFSFEMTPGPEEIEYHRNIPILYAIMECRSSDGFPKQYDTTINSTWIAITGLPPWRHTVRNLLPWTQLDMRISFHNKHGIGRPSEWRNYHTKMAELVKNVRNMKEMAHSTKSFTISWEDPLRLNGRIAHYEASWSIQPSKGWYTHKVPNYQKYYKYNWEKDDTFDYDSPIVYWKVRIVGQDGKGPITNQSVFRVAPGAPGYSTEISAKAVDSRKVKVQWNTPENVGSGIVGYQIAWKLFGSLLDWQVVDIHRANANEGLVDKLRPNQTYQFKVIPRSSTALGVPSNIADANTWSDAPTAPPQNVRGTATRSESIEVFWEEPPKEHQNGVITGYKVLYTKKVGRKPLFVTTDSTARNIYLQGLSKFAEYSIWVKALNAKGESPPSPAFQLYTIEKVPEGAPQSVQAQAMNDTYIAVTWQPPLLSTQNGRIIGYKIYYTKHKDTVEFGSKDVMKLYGEKIRDALIHDHITGEQNYRINVAAFTILGDGIKSANIYLTTPRKRPPSPVVKVTVDQTINFIRLRWWPRTKFAQYFKIEYGKSLRKYDMMTHKKVKMVPSDIRMSVFDDLDAGVWYCFIVSADLGEHDGWTASSIVWQKTSDGLPTGSPLFFEGTTESSSTIRLRWEEPDPWKQNGVITGYLVFYKSPEDLRWQKREHNVKEGEDIIVYMLTHLKASTNYRLKVQAFTRVGNGPTTSTILIQTSRELLPIVDKLRVMEIEQTSAFIHWSDPVNTIRFNDDLKFIINYKAYKTHKDKLGNIKIINIDETVKIYSKQYLLDNLIPGTTYLASVSVETAEAGVGDPENITFTTQVAVPAEIPSPHVNNSSQLSKSLEYISLYVGPASDVNGPITHYLLFVIDIGTSSTLSSLIKTGDFSTGIQRYRRDLNSSSNVVLRPDYHIAASFQQNELPLVFHLGNGAKKGEFSNQKLTAGHYYAIFIRAYVKTQRGMIFSDSGFSQPIFYDPNVMATSGKNIDGEKNNGMVLKIGAGAAAVLLLALIVFLLVFFIQRRQQYHPESARLLSKKKRSSFRNSKKLSDPTEVHRLHCNTPGMMSHPPIPVEILSMHVADLKADNGLKFIQEFESIHSSEKCTSENARMNNNVSKNRYPNVVAYDQTRVKLEGYDQHNSSDYINANYIDGYCKEKAYIATQGPMKNTIDDFWMLCWEQNIQTIVMMTKLEERGRTKCEQYWPAKGFEVYGSIKVELKCELRLCNDYTRTFEVSSTVSGESRTVKHYQYLQWPDPGVPTCAGPVLAFVRRVHSFEPPGCGPTLVHCSAGVGRSACYIAIDAMLERIKYDNMIDIYGYVTMMRSQRNFMVQTDEQYMFVYDVLVEAIECGVTELTSREFAAEFKQLTALLDNGRETLLETQFKSIVYNQQLLMENASMTAAHAHSDKNRHENIVPFDGNRFQLRTLQNHEGSNYINASFVDGYYRANNFIVTQSPTEKTVSDFWRMLIESKCSIVVMLTNLEDKEGHDQCYQYWPTTKSMCHYCCVIDPVQENRFANFVIREFKITDFNDQSAQSTRYIRQYHYQNWPAQRVPNSSDGVIELIGLVQKANGKINSQHSPVVIHSSFGAGRAGVFVTLSIALESFRNEDKVDIYQIVKSLRHQRPYMVETLEQYEYCYKVTWDFLKNFDFIA